MLLKSAFNMATHTSLKTQEAITEFRWTVLPHPPYITDLALSGFHLFGAFKDAVCGKGFGSHYEVIDEVKMWLGVQNQIGTLGRYMLLFVAGASLLK
jgi:hypothetical protein